MDISRRIMQCEDDIRRKQLYIDREQSYYDLVRLREPAAAFYHKQNIAMYKNQISMLDNQLRKLKEMEKMEEDKNV